MVDSNILKIYAFKIIDWVLYLGLIFASGFFMIDCVQKFKEDSTYYVVSSKIGEPVELPTLTICFKPCFKESTLEDYNLTHLPYYWKPKSDFPVEEIFEKSAYEIGKDFNISIKYAYENPIIIDKPSNIAISSINVEVRAVVTQNQGKCYKLILNGTEEKMLVMIFIIKVILNKDLASKPKHVMVSVK